jgi:hypothetical protein
MVAALYLIVEILVPGLELLVVQRLHVEVGPLQLLLEHVDLVHSAPHTRPSQYLLGDVGGGGGRKIGVERKSKTNERR